MMLDAAAAARQEGFIASFGMSDITTPLFRALYYGHSREHYDHFRADDAFSRSCLQFHAACAYATLISI